MTPRRAALLTVVALAGFAALRVAGVGGAGSAQSIAAETLAAGAAAAMSWLMWRHLPGGRRSAVAQTLATVTWAAGVLAPLWMTAHAPAPLLDDVLGGARRELTTARSGGGPHLIEIRRPDSAGTTSFWLQIDAGGRKTTVRRTLREGPHREPLRLDADEQAVLFVERADGPLAIRVLRAPLDRTFVLVGLALALLLAALADVLSARAAPRVAGATTAVVAATAAFELLLAERSPSATAVVGRLAVAVVGGAFAGGLWGLLAARLGRRPAEDGGRRRSHVRRSGHKSN